MERIFYFMVLFVLSQQSILNVSGEPAKVIHTNGSTAEYLTVDIPSFHNQQVLECWMKLTNLKTDKKVEWRYYSQAKKELRMQKLDYLGDKDNSCSFRIRLEHWPTFFKHLYTEEYGKIEILTVFKCRPWYTLDWFFGCSIQSSVNFSPRGWMDKLAAKLSKIRATWNLATNRSALTVLMPSAKGQITSCELLIDPDEDHRVVRQVRAQYENPDHVMYVNSSVVVDQNTGISFTGIEDNSCSIQIHLDRSVSDHVFNKTWSVIQRDTSPYYPYGAPEIHNVFEFSMMSKKTWIDTGYSIMIFEEGDNDRSVKLFHR